MYYNCWLNNSELKFSSISYSYSPSTSISEGGFETHPKMMDAW
jgi:hypothetical protein